MIVVTRGNQTSEFVRRKIEATMVEIRPGDEFYWEVPEAFRDKVRAWFALDDYVLWFS